MKIVTISDTHGRHDKLALPKGDVLVCAGDITRKGSFEEVRDFLRWFSATDFKHRIFTAGNHDFCLDKEWVPRTMKGGQRFNSYVRSLRTSGEKITIPDNVIYLNDSGLTIDHVNFWGSPVTPFFHDWAFNRNYDEIKKHWDLIPVGTDVLITHGPPRRILDKTVHGDIVGCPHLHNIICDIKPKFHIFGHIHEGYGILAEGETTFVNASVLNEDYRLCNAPIEIEI